ncbi:MAG: hypothetical protein JXR96_12065 [Deltaproteobacteria bacterium]|nr:hypothetical protein [Deltaproteobacteria bacterium]
MKRCLIVCILSALACAAGCSSSSAPECSAASDCTGDPGEGCVWLCVDHACEKSCDTHECEEAADCTGDPGQGCVWLCVDQHCQRSCGEPECEVASDCTGDPGESCVWLCVDQHCQASCGEPECEVAEDCQDEPWLEDCIGHFECIDGECFAVCDDECSVPEDCAGLEFPLDCQGHWICDQNHCKPVCDQGCEGPSDCEGLPWPVGCRGHWECNADHVCVPVCDPSCTHPRDCWGLEFPIDCIGFWDCVDGYCQPYCGECGGEGETIAPGDPICCPGLVSGMIAEIDTTGDCTPIPGGMVCIDCPSGACGPGENFCNCPDDCPFEPNCVPEGEWQYGDGPLCCAGLISRPWGEPEDDCTTSNTLSVCVRCPNGECGLGENVCTCPEDCSATGCTPEGEYTSPVEPNCCPGLEAIVIAEYEQGACSYIDGALVCAACPNGECGLGENFCNCPDDCPGHN